MKILLCSPNNKTGGIAQWTNNILSYYNIANTSNIELQCYYPIDSSNVLNEDRTLIGRLLYGIRNYLPFVYKIQNEIRRTEYDACHLCTSGSISFLKDYLTLKICKKRGLKTILHLHFGRIPEVLKSNSLERRLFLQCLKYTDKIIAIDSPSYKALRNIGIKSVYNIPNPLSELDNIGSQNRNNSRQDKLILFVGHVKKAKGIEELIIACKGIPELKIEIMGLVSDEYKNELLELSDMSNSIIFRGNCSHEEVIESMSKCTIFVLPSYTEGFPNVILEAMSCGTPIISTPVGAIREMLDIGNKDCGVIVPIKDSTSLRTQIIELLSNKEERDILGKRALSRVKETYSMNKIWKKLTEIWNDCNYPIRSVD